ncbi:MAG TPA: CBS domain-containing protein [Gemmatimonadales bacterium]|nr:CBS domain-containing protein [Gemmatimonadales bacterium]
MKARELMSAQPACCTPDDSIQEAARLMRDGDCGCVPVVENKRDNRLLGVITDRDIACRCTAEGKGPETPVSHTMSQNPKCCGPDDDVEVVERIMAAEQVRRVPVVDARGCCVGIIAQADLAVNERAASDSEVGRVVERISEPAHAPGPARGGNGR